MKEWQRKLLQERLKPLRPAGIEVVQSALALRAGLSDRLRTMGPVRSLLNLPSRQIYGWQDWLERGEGDSEVQLDPEAPDLLVPLPRTNEAEVHWQFVKHQKVSLQRTFVAIIKGGRVCGGPGGSYYFNRQGDLLWDLSKEHWLYFKNLFATTLLYLPRPRYLSGTVAVITHPSAYNNYGHWVFDALPRFGLLERAGFGPDQIDYYAVGYEELPFQLKTLADAGIPREKIVPFTRDTHLQADQLLLPFLSTYQDQVHQRSTLDYVRRLSLTQQAQQPGDRLVFISRQDATFRRLLQEEQIRPALEAMGFEFVTLAGKDLAQTAALFADTRVVVGTTGSGLMNTLYCPRGTRILEIVGPRYFTCHHWYIAWESGLEHHYFMGEGPRVPDNQPLTGLADDIRVDPDALVAYIEMLVNNPQPGA